MDTIITQRQYIIEVVQTLPDDSLNELSNFIDYLRYKTNSQQQSAGSKDNFLLSITALGDSKENNISERAEEILAEEVNPVSGWSLHSDG